MNSIKLILFIAAIFLAIESATGEETSPPLETHMFVSQGFIYSTGSNYLVESKNGSFDFTEAGFNVTKQINDQLSTGLQVFGRSLGSSGHFDAKLDWFYLDYHWRDELGLRAGRVKIPFGLYNEVNDVDAGRVPILLPQSIYPSVNRNYLLAQNGMELYGYKKMGGAGALDYRLYSGTIDIDTQNTPGSPVQVQSLNIPYVIGSRVLWETPVEGLRVGASVQSLKLDGRFLFVATPVHAELPALLWAGSAEYSNNNWIFAAEYSQWKVDISSDNPALVPSRSTTSERGYISGFYRISDRLQPGLYYSILHPDTTKQSGIENRQNDLAATLRTDLNANWILKFETHYMNGTADVNSALNDGATKGDQPVDWLVFMIKTTVFF